MVGRFCGMVEVFRMDEGEHKEMFLGVWVVLVPLGASCERRFRSNKVGCILVVDEEEICLVEGEGVVFEDGMGEIVSLLLKSAFGV